MGRSESYEAKTEQLIQPLIDANNFELVDVEFVKEGSDWYLRVYIDKDGGITVDDCELISRAFNEILDREDYISEQYIFEVSSPGLMRPLKKEKDYKRSVGKLIDTPVGRTAWIAAPRLPLAPTMCATRKPTTTMQVPFLPH